MQQKINGLIVVDKPVNITSAKVVSQVKKTFNVKKVGHTGTLDPLASGILLCCINDATRLARFFLHGSKTYQAVLRLGMETDTQDAGGAVISICNEVMFSENTIRSVFKQFEGATKQIPPVYSALKHKGVPLYKLARKGKPVQKPARRICIKHIKIFKLNLPEIHFEVACSGGTYIRTLCADIGATLGCGGYLKELRRIENCGFTIKEAITLSQLKEFALCCDSTQKLLNQTVSMSNALPVMPKYTADIILAEKIKCGRNITIKDLTPYKPLKDNDFIKIVDQEDNLMAVLSYNIKKDKFGYCCVFHK